MIRLGLCCIFKEQPIKFRRTTAKFLSKFSRAEQLQRLSEICLSNAKALMAALEFCKTTEIGDFRINSQILPLKTHPEIGYDIFDLPGGETIINGFRACGKFCRKNNIRTTFHPDQFIILSSPNPEVVKRSLADLEYHAQVAEWVNADVINLHAGGTYGDKKKALKRLRCEIDRLADKLRRRLTLENDDRCYSPDDLLQLCLEMGVPMVYDVHHHRCLTDRLSIEAATEKALKTWDREPLFHISSPISGWQANDIRKHHDFINILDFPRNWMTIDLTIEVEAKAKELAVLRFMQEIKLTRTPE